MMWLIVLLITIAFVGLLVGAICYYVPFIPRPFKTLLVVVAIVALLIHCYYVFNVGAWLGPVTKPGGP